MSENNIPETNRQISSRHPIYAGMLLDAVEVLLIKSQTISEFLSKKKLNCRDFLVEGGRGVGRRGGEGKMISTREKV